MTPEYSKASASLAANQGLYNGFLAAGLVWGLISGQFSVKLFFLVCVIIAGLFGAFTARRSILYIQAMPALLGLILLYLSR
jgi:putative membrane protein